MKTRQRVGRCCCNVTTIRAPFLELVSGLATTISDNAGVLHPDAFTTYGPSGWDINAATGVAMSGFAVDLEPWGGAA
ncbi:MAG TPA: hypothetical protein VK171_03935, partial [Fimbriimonas sp.]|nr:hypothetical protein [Fimbriimonas sp.]